MADNDRIQKLLSAGSISQTRSGKTRQARRRRELSKMSKLAASASSEASKADKDSRVKIGTDRGLRAQKQVGTRMSASKRSAGAQTSALIQRPIIGKLSARRSLQIHQLSTTRSFSVVPAQSAGTSLAAAVDLAKTSVARTSQSAQRSTLKRAQLKATSVQG